jgi:hypothetical protein
MWTLAARSVREFILGFGAHGGSMHRSLSRLATLIGSVSAALLVAGCASTPPGGQILGMPRPVATAPSPPASGDFLAGLQRAIANELNAVNAISSATGPYQPLVLLEALNNPSSLRRAENFSRLLSLGAAEAAKREQVVISLLADVQRNSYIQGVTVGGASLSASLNSILNGETNLLATLATNLAGASLPDVARATKSTINASTRIYGLIEPQVHLGLAGGLEIAEINALAAHGQQLAVRLAAQGATRDHRYFADMLLMTDLTSMLATARQTADSTLSSILSLTASGFPGNKATLIAARNALSQLRSPSGALSTAQVDVATLVTDLGLGA